MFRTDGDERVFITPAKLPSSLSSSCSSATHTAYVEACLKPAALVRHQDAVSRVTHAIEELPYILPGNILVQKLEDIVQHIRVEVVHNYNQYTENRKYFLRELELVVNVFTLNDDAPVEELVEESQGEQDLVACNHWQLPCQQFDGLWER
jgi:uncharacterized protein (DUF1499 family)